MFQQLVSRGASEFRPYPLTAIIERRLKTIWVQVSRPECSATTLCTEDNPYGNCFRSSENMDTYPLGPLFYYAELCHSEFLVALVMYADSLLNLNQLASLFNRDYNKIHSGINEVEATIHRASSSSDIGSTILPTG